MSLLRTVQRSLAICLIAAAGRARAQPTPKEATAVMLEPGVISTSANEFGGTVTPDGSEMYFSRSVPRSYMYGIFMSRRVDGRWGPPEIVPFSGTGRDFDPNLSPDGKSMVFISDRQVVPGRDKRDYDVWLVEREPGGGWGAPRHLDPPANTERPIGHERDGSNNEWFASLAADGTLYVASDGYEGGDRMQIYRLPRNAHGYGKPENLGPVINEGQWTGEPMIAPDQSFLLFCSFDRKGGYGGWDIYVSRRAANGGWLPPENLGPAVNTSARDYSPRLQPDGHTLVFTSERNFVGDRTTPVSWTELEAGLGGLLNGNGNLYRIDLCALHLRSIRCP